MKSESAEIINAPAGQLITQGREAKGWKQSDLAAELSISTKQLRKYEQGKFPKFKREVVVQIDGLLGTKVGELLKEQNVPRGTLEQAETKNPGEPGLIEVYKQWVADKEKLISQLESKSDIELRLKQVEAGIERIEKMLQGFLDRVPAGKDGAAKKQDVRLSRD